MLSTSLILRGQARAQEYRIRVDDDLFRSEDNRRLLDILSGWKGTGLMGALRPQTPHRSPRQAFGGNWE